jgi:hypothetical protein
VKLTSIAMLALGYVLGARAGRERYDEIANVVQQAGRRLDNR